MTRLRLVRRLCLGYLLVALALAAVTAPSWQFDSDILALFPEAREEPARQRADRALSRRIERQLLLLVSASDASRVSERLPTVRQRLSDCDCLSLPETAASTGDLAEIYRPHTPRLLTRATRQTLEEGGAQALIRRAERRLYTDPSLASGIGADPLGTLAAYQRQARPDTGQLSLDGQGHPYVPIDGRRYYLVRAELAGSPYSVAVQERARGAIERALAPVRELAGARVLKTGAVFYTIAGTDQARQEISTVGLGSLVGIVLLLLLVFRHPVYIALAFLPIAAGVFVGLAVTNAVFGAVHVMALVFGASLVGVAIDYSLHFFAARAVAHRHWLAQTGTRRLLAPLGLGLVTSACGYLSFTLAGFPGFSQIAVLSTSGLVTALAVVLGVYPRLLRRPPPKGLPRRLEAALAGWRHWHERALKPLRSRWVLLAVLALCAAGLSQWSSNDDIRQMQKPDAQLARTEALVREHLGQATALQYLLVQASDPQTLLRRLETLEQALGPVIESGQLARVRSLADWVPSAERQRANAQLWQQTLMDSGLLPAFWERVGVASHARQRLVRQWQKAEPLSPGALEPLLADRPDAPVSFRAGGDSYAAMTLHGLNDRAAVARVAGQWDWARWVDPVGRTNQLLEHYRHAAMALLAGAYLVVWLVLCARYGLAGAARVVWPPLLASLLTLSVLTAVGQPISVFHLMALFLVLGIGVDYTLFLREGGRGHLDTLLAIGLSTVTTVLSFGLLALSATAAIHSFGLTVWVGILLAFALAPLALGGSRRSQ